MVLPATCQYLAPVRTRSDASHVFVASTHWVHFLSARHGLVGTLSDPVSTARAIGVARLVIGGGLLAAPVAATRAYGVDSATAKRTAYLARMAAARDIGLGVGTLVGRDRSLWLAMGAAADAVDAVAIGAALRQGTVRGLPAAGTVPAAAVAAAVGLYAAWRLRRR